MLSQCGPGSLGENVAIDSIRTHIYYIYNTVSILYTFVVVKGGLCSNCFPCLLIKAPLPNKGVARLCEACLSTHLRLRGYAAATPISMLFGRLPFIASDRSVRNKARSPERSVLVTSSDARSP